MRILVTGGAGYIGSHMTRLLVKTGHTPVVLDSLEFGHRQALLSFCNTLCLVMSATKKY